MCSSVGRFAELARPSESFGQPAFWPPNFLHNPSCYQEPITWCSITFPIRNCWKTVCLNEIKSNSKKSQICWCLSGWAGGQGLPGGRGTEFPTLSEKKSQQHSKFKIQNCWGGGVGFGWDRTKSFPRPSGQSLFESQNIPPPHLFPSSSYQPPRGV
jgi:hypothetical protein